MSHWSIRARLTCWFAAVLGVVVIVLASLTWWTLQSVFTATVDEGLRGRVDALAQFLNQAATPVSFEELQDDLREYAALDPGWDLIRITEGSGKQIFLSTAFARSEFAPNPTLVAAGRDRYDHMVAHGRPFRMISRVTMIRTQLFTIQVAVPTRELQEAFGQVRWMLLVLVPLGILAACVGGYLISGRALAPVDRIAGAARAITAKDLGRRLDVPATGDELQRLSETLNEMLGRLEAAFRETTRFTADASHELRTPISLIRTSAELALRRERNADDYRTALQDILREAERTSGLVQDLLTLARADSGVDSLQPAPVDLHALIDGLRPSLERLAEQRGLDIDILVPRVRMICRGDRAALGRLLLILIDNATKYTPAPGRVSVRLEDGGREALVEVADTGIGIGADDLSRVFDRFYRADKARSRDSGGAGLGLSIAKWIVDEHGGRIEIDSEPNKGCRVRVSLPAEIPKLS